MKNIKSKTKAFSLITLATIAMGTLAGVSFFVDKKDNTIETFAWSGKQTPNYSAHYYDACEGKTGEALKSALKSFNHPKSKSYNWERFEKADEVENHSDSVWCIYTCRPIKKSAHVGGSYSWNTWNREHVYPQTRYPNSDDDTHNIFACEGQINNNRGTLAFGNASKHGGSREVVHGHTTDCYSTSRYFEPPLQSKGDIARAVMYTSLYYGYGITEKFESVEVLLEWHTLDPVDNRDIFRNNTIASGPQKNRNPFVDHPEWAYDIWGDGNTPDVDVPTPKPEETETSTPSKTETSKPSETETAKPETSTEEKEVALETITLNKSNVALKVGETSKLSATLAPANADKNIVFSSSDRNIVGVDNNGNLKAYKVGQATVTATSVKYSNISATCKVSVTAAPAQSGDFELLTAAKTDYTGEYIIGHKANDTYKTMSNSSTKKTNLVDTPIVDGKIKDDTNSIKLEKTGNKYYVVNKENKVLTSDSTNNGNRWGDRNSSAAFTITNKGDKFTFVNGVGNYLTYNDGAPRILCYDHELNPINLFERKPAGPGSTEIPAAKYNLDAFYGDFMSLITCDGGTTAPSKDNWNKVKSLYNSLSGDEKGKLERLATNDSKYGKMVERYDYIVKKYGVQDYANFMGRTITNEVNKVPTEAVKMSTKDLVIIIAAVSLVSISMIMTIYLVIKRRQKRS